MSRKGRFDEAEHKQNKIQFGQEIPALFLAPRRPKKEGSTHCAFQFYVIQQFFSGKYKNTPLRIRINS